MLILVGPRNFLEQYVTGGCSLNRLAKDIIRAAGDWDYLESKIVKQTSQVAECSIMPKFGGT